MASAEEPAARAHRVSALRAVERDPEPPRGRSLPLPARPVAVWVVATPLAELAGAELTGLAIAVAAVAALVAALLVTGAARAFAAVAMLPAALAPGVPLWAWVVGGAALALASATAGHGRAAPTATTSGDDLRRQLARARRRGERVALLLIRSDDERAVSGLLAQLRWTDSGEIARHDGGHELHCLLDMHGLDRDGVERRVRAAVRRPVALGWATFPDDGLTVDALRDAARDRLRAGRPPAPGKGVQGEDAQHVAQSTSSPGG